MWTQTMPSAAGATSERFLKLIRLLDGCVDPYLVAASVLAEDLRTVGELRREMGLFLDGMITLARMQKYRLPQSFVADARRECQRMGQLSESLELRLLFSSETRQRCGRQAIPILALIVSLVDQWVEYGTAWLDMAARLKARADSNLGKQLPAWNGSGANPISAVAS